MQGGTGMDRLPTPDQYRIPKNNARLGWLVLGLLALFGAVALMVAGFVDAGRIAPEETNESAPEIEESGMLPRTQQR